MSDSKHLPIFKSRIPESLLKGLPAAESDMFNAQDVNNQQTEYLLKLQVESQVFQEKQTDALQRMANDFNSHIIEDKKDFGALNLRLEELNRFKWQVTGALILLGGLTEVIVHAFGK